MTDTYVDDLEAETDLVLAEQSVKERDRARVKAAVRLKAKRRPESADIFDPPAEEQEDPTPPEGPEPPAEGAPAPDSGEAEETPQSGN